MCRWKGNRKRKVERKCADGRAIGRGRLREKVEMEEQHEEEG